MVWWNGPLNVEELAGGAVRCALTAARARASWLSTGVGVGVGVGSEPTARGPEPISGVQTELIAANFASIAHLSVDGRPASGFAELSGYFRCSDGWLRTHANFPHHRRALCEALGVDGREQLLQTLAQNRAIEAEQAIRDAGGVAAAVRSRHEWAQSAAGRAVAADPWIRFAAGERSRRPDPRRLRVLDFTRVIAGPTATKFLAALGADVLRIDPPGMPELLDQHLDTGAGKRSALADLNVPQTLARVMQLAADADVVMLGYRPGALARFGLDPQQLHARHPHLAVVQIDAWGDSGPWADQRGFDSIVQAATGIGATYRQPDGSPGALPVQALDHATGYGAAAAALALLERGGVAHLSLARTAEQLFKLPAPTGAPAGLTVPIVSVEGPHGLLRQVAPLVGAVQPPGGYGAASLQWLTGTAPATQE